MSISFEDRVAIVTGAGAGMGREHALLLARHGAKVVVNDLGGSVHGLGSDGSPAERLVDEIRASGGHAIANHDNVADPGGAVRIVETALDTFGRLDILVNNAGILRDKTFAKMPLEDFRAVMDVHLYGTVNCTKAAWEVMKQRKYGRVVVTTSHAGVSGGFGQSNYGAAKMAVLGFMNCLAREGARDGVRINAILPAAATRMTEAQLPPALSRYLRADLISPAVAWLCSEQCDHSGLIVSAVGGYFARVQLFEGAGVQFDPTQPVTADMVAQALEGPGQFEQPAPVHPEPLGNLESRLHALGLL